MLGSHLGQVGGYAEDFRDFHQFLHANSGLPFTLGHNHPFTLNPFKFIINQLFYPLT
jgi:hypothetical protein